MLPFTHAQFVFVFALYNGVIWPLQWVAQAVGIVMLFLLWRPSRNRDRVGIALLAAMWIWTGLAYHVVFFSLINPAATLFGMLLVYAVIGYPALGLLLGERVLELPAFGLTPCPVVLATLGMLLLATGPMRLWLFVIPVAWALIGGSAAVLLRMPQDWPLLVSPVLLAI